MSELRQNVNKPEGVDTQSKNITDGTNTNMSKKKNRGMTSERKIFLTHQHLKREVELSARNTKNFRRKWREQMMKIQMPDMKKKVVVAKITFDRALDIKNYCAQLIVECLEKSEVQRRRNIVKHMEAIEKFTSIYHNRLESANIFYQHHFNSLIDGSMTDMERIESVHNEDEIMLRAIIYKDKRRIQSMIDNTNTELLFKLESIRDNCENLTKIAVLQLEEKLSNKWKHLNKIISAYLSATRYRRFFYEDLTAIDASDREIIKHKLMRNAELYKSIQQLRHKISKLNKDTDEKIAHIENGKLRFYRANQSLIEKFHNEQKLDKIQLNTLSKNYNLTIKQLQRLVKRARPMQFLIRRCRKFQIQSEKILPVRLDVNEESNSLDVFWYRVGLAQVLTDNLRRDLEILKRERDRLHECLKCRMMSE